MVKHNSFMYFRLHGKWPVGVYHDKESVWNSPLSQCIYMIKMQNFPSSFSIVSAVIIWSFECHSLKKYDKNVYSTLPLSPNVSVVTVQPLECHIFRYFTQLLVCSVPMWMASLACRLWIEETCTEQKDLGVENLAI